MRTFRPYDLDQPYLLPPDLRSWLSEGHLALFVSDVVDVLDLSPILDDYERGDGRGYPPYHLVMMVKLLVYGYCTGKVSSRKIENATWEDVAFRVLSGNQQPDHDSIADFADGTSGAGWPVRAGSQAMPGSGPGEAGPGVGGREQGEGERFPAQEVATADNGYFNPDTITDDMLADWLKSRERQVILVADSE